MTQIEVFEEAVQILQDEGYESSVREDYSGRGMYGLAVPAIVSDASGARVVKAVCSTIAGMVELSSEYDLFDLPILFDDLVPVRQDNMGRSKVYY